MLYLRAMWHSRNISLLAGIWVCLAYAWAQQPAATDSLTTASSTTGSPQAADSLAAFATLAYLPPGYHFATLDNGLSLLVVEDHRLPTATVRLAVLAGSVYQHPGYTGVPQLVAHTLALGPGGYQSPAARQAALRQRGWHFGLQAGPQVQQFVLQGQAQDAEAATAHLLQLLRRPDWDTLWVGRAKQLLLAEQQARDASAARYLQHRLDALLWGPLYERVVPVPDYGSLRDQKTTRLADFYQEHYTPGRTLLVVSGDVQPQAVYRWVRAQTLDWAGAVSGRKMPDQPHTLAQDTLIRVELEGQDSPLITAGWVLPAQDTLAYLKAQVLQQLLQGYNRFTAPFRKQELAHGLTAGWVQARPFQGAVKLTAIVGTGDIPRMLDLLKQQLAEAARSPFFAQRQIDEAIQQLYYTRQYAADQPSQYGDLLAQAWAQGSLRLQLDSFPRITPEDIQAFVAQYLDSQPMAVGILGTSTQLQQPFLAEYAQQFRRSRTAAPPADTTHLAAASLPDSSHTRPDTLAQNQPTQPALPTAEEIEAYRIHYAFGAQRWDSTYEHAISRIVLYLNLNPAAQLTLIGHTDSPGSADANQRMALLRATTLKQYIIRTYRIFPQRLHVMSKGESEPLVPETDNASRRMNRRLEFKLQ